MFVFLPKEELKLVVITAPLLAIIQLWIASLWYYIDKFNYVIIYNMFFHIFIHLFLEWMNTKYFWSLTHSVIGTVLAKLIMIPVFM